MNEAEPSEPAGRAITVDLERHRWRRRLLLCFAPDARAPAFRRQLEALAAQEAGLRERDLLLYELLDDPTPPSRTSSGAPADAAGSAAPPRLGVATRAGAEETERLRREFAVDAPFALLLVGKDGSEKARWREPVEPQRIFELIDRMPMRRREMREGEGT